jgi:hypothetical protein
MPTTSVRWADLTVQPLVGVVFRDLTPLLFRVVAECEDVASGGVEVLGDRWSLSVRASTIRSNWVCIASPRAGHRPNAAMHSVSPSALRVTDMRLAA